MSLTEELLKNYEHVIETITLVPSEGGRFECQRGIVVFEACYSPPCRTRGSIEFGEEDGWRVNAVGRVVRHLHRTQGRVSTYRDQLVVYNQNIS